MEKVLGREVREWSTRNTARVFAIFFATVPPGISKREDT
jgi:hypothetical protein